MEQICELAALHCEIHIPIVKAFWEHAEVLYRRELSDFIRISSDNSRS
jgi:hypothetical protein